jgi:mannose-6-phosphate isomerase
MIDRETDVRPWGSYTVLDSNDVFKVKRIEVLPGRRLSYQRHAHRSEHWFVVTGDGLATLDGRTMPVHAASTIDVPVGVAHRIENTGSTVLVFIEVQHGESFAEEDIVRLDDDFGRAYAAAAQQIAIPPGVAPTRHRTS